MCCFFTALVLLGPRFAGMIWWLLNPGRWTLAFQDWPIATWLWPILGIIFLPWTTLMYLIVFPLGVVGLDWLWLALGVVADIAWYAGGGLRRRVPGYAGTY
jgi:hypothetical protein